jgi:7SK snRNA methylphosphate capping enzyme
LLAKCSGQEVTCLFKNQNLLVVVLQPYTTLDLISMSTPEISPNTAQVQVQAGNSFITKNRKNRQHHALARYGNYRNYYFHRTATVPDDRLSLLPRDFFQGKAVLDLGCNGGKLTIETCEYLGATRALGIDIDDVLIEKAKDECVKALGDGKDSTWVCTFVCTDFMQTGYWDTFTSRQGTFDTILLLSITKWLHLHHGDLGLISLFRNLFQILPSGGTLVIEPQEWQNYKRAVSKNTSLRPVFKELKMRPNFEAELAEVGFTLSIVIAREEGGFSRPLMIWRKLDG